MSYILFFWLSFQGQMITGNVGFDSHKSCHEAEEKFQAVMQTVSPMTGLPLSVELRTFCVKNELVQP